MSSPDRRPLYNVLINGIKEGKITEVYDSSYFTTKKTLKEIESSLFTVDTTDVGLEQMNEDLDAYRNGTKKIDAEYYRIMINRFLMVTCMIEIS